jgi:hypothetical protein
MYLYLEIDPGRNMLLCSPALVGTEEIAEVYSPSDVESNRVSGHVLSKVADPGRFLIRSSCYGHEPEGKHVDLGEKTVMRVLRRNLSGIRRRKFASREKVIVDLERDENSVERKVSRAKTGSVRKKRGQVVKKAKKKKR